MMLQQAVRDISGENYTDLSSNQIMEVDYVKVWQLGGCSDIIGMCGDFIVNNADNADNTSVGNIINFSPSACGWHLINTNGQISKSFISSAASEINIYPGFQVDNGCDFTAQIKTCEVAPANYFKIPIEPIENTFLASEYTSKELNIENGSFLYPNPTNESVKLQTASNSGFYEIYNNLGQLVLKDDVYSISTNIDLTSLKTGLYLIKYTDPIKKLYYAKTIVKN